MSEQDTTVEPDTEKDLAAQVEALKKELAEALKAMEKWKAHSRKNEERAKSNADTALKVEELEKQVADFQSRAEDAEKALTEREAADEKAKLASEVAKEKGIPDPSVLVGETKEELEAFADKIAALIPEKPKAPGAGVQGEVGSDIAPKNDDLTQNDLLRAAFKNA